MVSEGVSSDSFAYLDGAKNLLLHGCYCYDANSQPISLFPPLYSILLSGAMAVMGIGALPVFLVNTVLFILSFTMILRSRNYFGLKPWEATLFAFLVAHTLFGYVNYVLSENLFIPLLILWLILQVRGSFRNEAVRAVVILALEWCLVSVRYTSILLIASWYAADVLARLFSGEKPSKLFARTSLVRYSVPVLSAAFFIWLRKSIGDTGIVQHHFSFGSGKYSIYEYCRQVVTDMGGFFTGRITAFQLQTGGWLPYVSLLILLLFILFVKVRLHLRYILFLAISLVLHIVVLWSVWVEDKLYGRYFLWFYVVLFLFAELNRRHRQGVLAYVRNGLVALSTVFLLYNDLYQLDKSMQKSFNNQYQHRIAYYDRLRVGYFVSDTVTQPGFEIVDGKRYLVSPCSRWNIPVRPKPKTTQE
jgi:hypothetical protein